MNRVVGTLRSNPIPIGTLLALAAGVVAGLGPDGDVWRGRVWTIGLLLCGAPVLLKTAVGLVRGRFAADVVASLAVVTAFALGQPFVGLVIVLMQSGGEALERLAEGRATNALRELQDAAPGTVHVVRGAAVEDVDPGLVRVGDTILVRPGEVVPCDGEVISGRSHVDTARITGEPIPLTAHAGSTVMSGTVNQEGPLMVRVAAIASESQYARIVELVRQAQASRAPLQRVADRYAVWFTPITILVCASAYAVSRDWSRVLAVLAVATPCPLILATPVAVLGGMNRAARRNILVRNGAALEALGGITSVVFDKTGTITIGRPAVSRVVRTGRIDASRVLALAAAVEQYSSHLLARTVVEETIARRIEVPDASGVREEPGRGVEGQVDGSHVVVGARSFLAERLSRTAAEIEKLESLGQDNSLQAYVAVNGELAGIIQYADRIRPGMRSMIEDLSRIGVKETLLLSGDRESNVTLAAASVGIGSARGDLLPEHKVSAVRALIARGESVLMIGDGTNDAPALSSATVGVALASQGRGIATESASVILLADEPARIVEAILISRRTMTIARQSILAGLGLSGLGMVAAAVGLIPPVAGALFQEGVDLAVIMNALRASSAGRVRETPKELAVEPDRPRHSTGLQFGQGPEQDRSGKPVEV